MPGTLNAGCVPHFPGKARLENPDLALEGIVGEGRWWGLLSRDRTIWARSVLHVLYLPTLLPLAWVLWRPPGSPLSGLPTVFFSLLSGNPPPKESHYWPAGAGVPWQVTQQKEAGGREGGKRTGHSGGQLSPCYQMGASQLTAAPTLWGIFCQGGKWGSLTFGKQVSPRTNIRSLPDTRRWREIWAGAFQMQGNECKAAGRGPAQEERAVGTVTRS